MTTTKTAIIGLGSMGYGMAVSALRAGLTVYGYDINPEQTVKFQSEGGQTAPLANIAPNLDCAAIVVLNADQTETVLFGEDGLVKRMKTGSVIIACATVPPAFARQTASRCADHGIHYLDAPISGGSIKAAAGALSIMASGSQKAFAAAQPVLDATAQTVFHIGEEAGAGSAMKAVNQLLAGVHIATMAEAMTFGMTQGIEPAKFMEVIPSCAGTSWMLENRGPHIVEGDYTPHSTVDIWLKDLGIVLDIAKSAKFSAPVTTSALQQFMTASRSGLGKQDDAAVAKVYARDTELALPN